MIIYGIIVDWNKWIDININNKYIAYFAIVEIVWTLMFIERAYGSKNSLYTTTEHIECLTDLVRYSCCWDRIRQLSASCFAGLWLAGLEQLFHLDSDLQLAGLVTMRKLNVVLSVYLINLTNQSLAKRRTW